MSFLRQSQKMLLLIILFYYSAAGFVDPEEQLIRHLFNNSSYDKRVKPPTFDPDGKKEPIKVMVTFALHNLIGIEDKMELMSIYAYVWETWIDSRLGWNPQDYGNIDQFTISISEIWAPDIYIANTFIMNRDDKASRTHAEVRPVMKYDEATNSSVMVGEVTLSYGALLQERCPVDMTYYPFDRQSCSLCISSSASRASQVHFHSVPEVLDSSQSARGGQWMLIASKGVDMFYQDYSIACIDLVLQRRSLYYIVNLFFPTVTICLLNTVGLFSRLEDAHGQLDLATLGQTTLLSLGVILLTVADQAPKGAAVVSLLGIFFIAMILQTLFATFTSIYLRNRYGGQQCGKPKCDTTTTVQPVNGPDTATTITIMKKRRLVGVRLERMCMLVHISFIFLIISIVLGIGYLKQNSA